MSILLTDVLKNMEFGDNEKIAYDQTQEITDDMIKQADEEGRAMAYGFLNELDKVAVDTHPANVTPDPGQLPGNANPAVQTSTAGGAVGSAASEVINSLINAAGHNGSVIQTPAGTMAAAKTREMVEPTAAEIAMAQESAEAAVKTSADYIIETLYNLHLA